MMNTKKTTNNKKIMYTKFVVIVLCVLILLRIFTLVLARYESETNSIANVDVAFYLLNEDFQEMTLNLDSLFPQDDAYEYTFSIGNTDGNKTAQIDMEYELTIRTTTNLPLTYELYKMNGTQKENAVLTNDIYQDDYETYFRKITTSSEALNYKEPKTNNYQLVVYFPENYNTTNYQDIIEMIEINVTSHQVTS